MTSRRRFSNLPARLTVSLSVLLLAACTSVPFDYPKQASYRGEAIEQGALATLDDIWLTNTDQHTAVSPLADGESAFDARLDLADMAESTIDAQYFLLKPDEAGKEFAGALLRAADRGVRVRLLLDDIFTTAGDKGLALLNAHENVEVRLFNPLSRNGISSLNYLADFKRANRRMHNKSFTVDGLVTIIGGRNIAGEYFDRDPSVLFWDFELLLFGGLIPEVGDSFDDFWNHSLSVPMEAFKHGLLGDDLDEARQGAEVWHKTHPEYVFAPDTGEGILAKLLRQEIRPYYAEAHVISDDPEKLLNPVSPEYQRLAQSLGSMIDNAESEVIIYSPYFIPRAGLTEYLIETQAGGTDVAILTNSLASNNHTAVHPSYKKYRKPLVEGGVFVFEASASGGSRDPGLRTTLHTKAIMVDARWLFIGSLNVDPRSIDINTEMGIILDAPEFVGELRAAIEESVMQYAYKVEIDEKGKLYWRHQLFGEEEILHKEPESSWWLRFKSGFYGILPLESQL
jgi:putative cardiolipin synthase